MTLTELVSKVLFSFNRTILECKDQHHIQDWVLVEIPLIELY